MKRYLTKGFRDTFITVGGWGWVYSVIPIPIIGLAMRLYFDNIDSVRNEAWTWLAYVLTAAIGWFLILFFINCAAAPYRLERDAHKNTKELLLEIEGRLPDVAGPRMTSTQKHRVSELFRSYLNSLESDCNVLFPRFFPGESFPLVRDISESIQQAGIVSLAHDGLFYNQSPDETGFIRIEYIKELENLALSLRPEFREVVSEVNLETRPG